MHTYPTATVRPKKEREMTSVQLFACFFASELVPAGAVKSTPTGHNSHNKHTSVLGGEKLRRRLEGRRQWRRNSANAAKTYCNKQNSLKVSKEKHLLHNTNSKFDVSKRQKDDCGKRPPPS
ncbi:hypothetical protein DdX_07940 [Ditylenchus destructor]|uniref:Uncharacterized protein n=1 Tax=Ditylenchus destructor TaxID=166010 RepID=A0AAD4N947_9BILA|nr:hypothetical protein DdX_07940 [Ditylenchus destructor]